MFPQKDIAEKLLVPPYIKAIVETNESKKTGSKTSKVLLPSFCGDSGIGMKYPPRRHKELTKKASIRICGEKSIFAAGLTQSLLFHILFGVLHIVRGIIGLAGAGGLDIFGGDAAPDLVRRYLCALQHQGAGGDDGALPHLAVVEDGGTHAYEGAVVDGAGVDGDVVADGDVAAYMRGADVVGHVYAASVLHVGAVTKGDGRHVTAHHSVEPHRALVAQRHVAHQRGVLAEVAVLAPTGRLAFVGFD